MRQVALGAHVMYHPNDRASPAVVVSIDHHHRSLVLVVMLVKEESSSALASDPVGTRLVSFKEVVIAAEDMRAKLSPLLPNEESNGLIIALLREHAICSECRGVFHVHPTALSDSDREQSRSTMNALQLRLDELNRQKREFIVSKQYDLVLALTVQILDHEKQLAVAKRGFERIRGLSCPFCGALVES